MAQKRIAIFASGEGTNAENIIREFRDSELASVELVLCNRTDAGVLSMFSTTTVFGTAVEVTLSELVLEAFYPADEATAEILRHFKNGRS